MIERKRDELRERGKKGEKGRRRYNKLRKDGVRERGKGWEKKERSGRRKE